MKQTFFPLLAISLTCAGCLDFVEPQPVLPPIDTAHAFISLSGYQENDSTIVISGGLQPGADENGDRQVISPNAVIVNGVAVSPDTIADDGFLRYRDRLIVRGAAAHVFTVDPPLIEGLSERPSVQWFGVRKLDPDTVRLRKGDDLVLHIDANLGTSQPLPTTRSWLLTLGLRPDDQLLRIGADGLPPATLRVPAELLPASSDGVIFAMLYLIQHGGLSTPNYIGAYSHLARSGWTVLVE